MNEFSKFRRLGVIKPVKGNRIPSLIVCFDTETHIRYDVKGNRQTFPFRLGVLCFVSFDKQGNETKRIYEDLTAIEDFIPLLLKHTKKQKRTYVFAHNIGFDLRVLNFFREVHNFDYISTPPIINERMFIHDVTIEKKHFTFLDTSNYAVISVNQLGQDMGYDKLKVDFTKVSDSDLLVYCKRDVDILVKFVSLYIRFVYQNNCGNFASTLASQSLCAYRHNFMPAKIYLHKHLETTQLERSSYSGGRVEVFKKGDYTGNHFYILDINSMYPNVMQSCAIPYKLRGYTEVSSVEQLSRVCNRLYTIAEVFISSNTRAYPLKRGGKLIFPVGQYWTTLHSPELELAFKSNSILKVRRYAAYDSDIIFKDYVDFFYKEKVKAELEGNKSWRYLCKIFMNSLYGKFGQTNVERKLIGTCGEEDIFREIIWDIDTGLKNEIIGWLGEVYTEVRQGTSTFAFPAIAGSVTSYARALLWKYVLQAGESNVWYVDTDSLIVTKQGYDNLQNFIDPHKLGYLKLEYETDNLIIRGCKDYSFNDITKRKGIKANSTQLENERFLQLQFESLKAWMNGRGEGGVKASYIVKARKGEYTKGIALPDGTIRPLILDDNVNPISSVQEALVV